MNDNDAIAGELLVAMCAWGLSVTLDELERGDDFVEAIEVVNLDRLAVADMMKRYAR